MILGLVNAFQRKGGVLQLGTKVDSLITLKGKVAGVNFSVGVIRSEIVINCSGANVGDLTKYDDVPDPFRSYQHEFLIIKPNLPISDQIPWLIDLDRQVHLRPEGNGRALIGEYWKKIER